MQQIAVPGYVLRSLSLSFWPSSFSERMLLLTVDKDAMVEAAKDA